MKATILCLQAVMFPLSVTSCKAAKKSDGATVSQPSPTISGVAMSTDEANPPYSLMMARSVEELRLKTDIFDRQFQISQAAWDVDQDNGTITFRSPRSIVATAPAQIVGTYNTDEGTWLWSWDNSTILPALATHAKLAQQYGEARGIAELTTGKLAISEEKAWEFAALTCKLGGYQGAFRAPVGSIKAFITFGDIELKMQK